MNKLLIMFLMIGFSCSGFANVKYDRSRIIFNDRAGTAPATIRAWIDGPLKNKGNGADFMVVPTIQASELVQKSITGNVQVDHAAESVSKEFEIVPPVLPMGGPYPADSYLKFMKVKEDDSALPKDRESLFWVRLRQIPARDSTKQNQIALVITSVMKFFYRPANMNGKPADVISSMKIRQVAGKLIIENPSAYYISFQELKIGSHPLFTINSAKSTTDIEERGMVAPKSTKEYTLKPGQTGKVSWVIVNDYGGRVSSSSASL